MALNVKCMMVESCMIMLSLSEKEIRSYSYVKDFNVLPEKKADNGCRLNNRINTIVVHACET